MQDLSNRLLPGVAALTGGASEAAGNTVSVPSPFSAPGIASESSRMETTTDPAPGPPTADPRTVLIDADGGHRGSGRPPGLLDEHQDRPVVTAGGWNVLP